MIAFDPNSVCWRAEQYYYDFLVDDMRELVPEAVVDHLAQCEYCREQMRQLEQVLSRGESETKSRAKLVDRALATMLRLHFAYIGRQVTCNTVKPFLPTLLDPALEVRIPTPITAHIDNCKQCSKDLEVIRGLNLDRKQLRRLSELFAEAVPPSSSPCLENSNAARSVAAMDFNGIGAEALSHVCKCPACRGLLHDERQKMLEKLTAQTRPTEFPCESVSNADVFDYVVPYGLDPATDQYGKFRKPFVSHVVTCRDCLGKVQQLHDLLYGIVDRPESGVITVYNIGDAKEPLSEPPIQELYSDFPITVELKQPKNSRNAEEPPSTFILNSALARTVSLRNLKPLARVGLAAAAVVLIWVALFFSAPAARGVTVEQIYKAIKTARNVYIASFVPGKKEPVQEQWVSRTLKVQLIKTGEEVVLWDIANRISKAKRLGDEKVDTAKLLADTVSELENSMTGCLGLVPFANLSVVPSDAGWSEVTDDNLIGSDKKLEVYDLTWDAKNFDGSIISRKWRVFVELDTDLPQKTEFYEKLPADNEYSLRSMKVVKYLSDSEMQAIISGDSF